MVFKNCICLFVAILTLGIIAIVSVAIYFAVLTNNVEETPIEEEIFEGSMRITNGDRYSAGLKSRKSPEYIIKAQTYEKLINTVYQRSKLKEAYLSSQVVAFQNGSLIVHFRLHLDRRKLPATPVELAYNILLEEVENTQPLAFRSLKVDPRTLNISGMVSSNKANVIDFLAISQRPRTVKASEPVSSVPVTITTFSSSSTVTIPPSVPQTSNSSTTTTTATTTTTTTTNTEPSLFVPLTRSHHQKPLSVNVDYGPWQPFMPSDDKSRQDTVLFPPIYSTPKDIIDADEPRVKDPTSPQMPPTTLRATLPPLEPVSDGSTFSLKPVRGTASEIKFDWEPEEGVSRFFPSNGHTNGFANRAGVAVAYDDPMHTEADNSQEFGSRIAHRPGSVIGQSDKRTLRGDSQPITVNRPSTPRSRSTPAEFSETVQQASSGVLVLRNATRKVQRSSTQTPFLYWRPMTPPRQHPQSAESNSRELIQNRDDPRNGFGLRVSPGQTPPDSLQLQNQSSHALIIRLPPGTRAPPKFSQSQPLSPKLQERLQPQLYFDSHLSPSELKWEVVNQERESHEEIRLPVGPDLPAALEGRVISADKVNPNNIRDPPPRAEDTRDVRQSKHLDYFFNNREIVVPPKPANITVMTSVSVKSSSSVILNYANGNISTVQKHAVPSNSSLELLNVSKDDGSDITLQNDTVTASQVPFTVTSIVMSFREADNATYTRKPNADDESSTIGSSNEHHETTSSTPESDVFVESFSEMMKLSALEAHLTGAETTNNLPSSESATLALPSVDRDDVNTLTTTWSSSSDNYFENGTFSAHIKTTANSTQPPSHNERTTMQDKNNNGVQEPVYYFDYVADDGPPELLYHEKDLVGFSSDELEEDEEVNVQLNSAEDLLTKPILQSSTTTAATTTSSTQPTTEKNKCSSPSFFQCQSGECVSAFSRCNRMKDCADNSDEEGCFCADFIRANVMNSTLCDGIADCWDYSDENQCEWCTPDMYVCPNARACISRSQVCDGAPDCPGGEDERSCVTLAPNLTAADRGSYWGSGLVMVRREGRWGKLCMQNFENFVSEAAVATGDLGRVLCRTMGYGDFEEVKEILDPVQDARDEGSLYYEPKYTNISTNSRSTSIQFVRTPCQSREVIQVMCKDFTCGKRHQALHSRARIVGGSNSTHGSWPWQAAVYKEGSFMCGATLINEHWLLSAAHCFYQAVDHYWTVRLGVLRRGSHSPYERVHRLSHIILHPNYISSSFINDIVMLRMAEPVEFSVYIRPICMPTATATQESIDRKQACTVVGWGQVDEEGDYLPDTLQEVKLPLISAPECRKRTTALTSYARVNENMFCAGVERGGRDACLGDSGGPIMCQESDGRWAITGITSNGFGCARASRPGIYTKVANYLPWINKLIEGSLPRPVRTSCHGHRCKLGKCLAKRQVCDGFVDCEDDSDEAGCTWPRRSRS